MLDESKVKRKLRLADETVRRCIGRNGFYASAQLYRKQHWIRDLVYSLEPLLDSGFAETVERHLEYTLRRQKSSGGIPERITEIPPSITGLVRLAKTLLERNPALLLLHIPTHDSDLLTLIGIERYSGKTRSTAFSERHRERVKRIWRHIETLLTPHGLLPEADWRDAMLNYVSETSFCNQVLLITAYRLAGRRDQAEGIERYVDRVFWDGERGHYRDYPSSTRFDTLGHALAILEGIVPKERIGDVVQALQDSSTQFGLRNIRPSYPEQECGQPHEYYQNSTIWPFIQGYAIAALAEAGRHDLAEEEFRKFTDLPGFNEWYSPSTGRPRGSEGQLWSAAGYIRAVQSMTNL